jgi:hypothetical protein
VREIRAIRLSSVEWAQHVALCVERELRKTDDSQEKRRLENLRNWHFGTLDDSQIAWSGGEHT